MPDRAPIDGPRKLNCLGRPAPAGVRPRVPAVRPEPEPVRDNKPYLGVGRKNSRVRRLDSRGSANK
jgi:hypothetical protein